MRYLAGIVLCFVVALVYSATRKDRPKEIVRDAFEYLFYMVAGVLVIAAVVFFLCKYK